MRATPYMQCLNTSSYFHQAKVQKILMKEPTERSKIRACYFYQLLPAAAPISCLF